MKKKLKLYYLLGGLAALALVIGVTVYSQGEQFQGMIGLNKQIKPAATSVVRPPAIGVVPSAKKPKTVACTSYEYSVWSPCGANGTQSRTVASQSPEGCIAKPPLMPVLSQTCTQAPPQPDPQQNAITRAEFAKTLVETGGMAIDTTGGPHFPDVQVADWYYQYIETVYNKGIMVGRPEGTFAPGDLVNRAEAAKYLDTGLLADKVCPASDATTYYPDVTSTDWFYGYVKHLAECKVVDVISGTGANYSPGEFLSRTSAQIMVDNYRIAFP